MKENAIFLENHLAQTTMFPFALDIDRADGVYIYDKSGKAYIDFISGIGVSNIGHGNAEIIGAMKDQMDRHMHVMVYGEYAQDAQIRAAALLTGILPAQLNTCYFVNSGTEANEAALKLAKRATGRTQIVSMRGAYHGSTHGSLSVSGNELKKSAFRPLLPGVHFCTFNQLGDLTAINHKTACVILETIQGDAGVRIPDIQYMRALRQRCTDMGALLILDEIQCGLGRAGTMFAFEQFEIVPDILTLGKALAGGMPVGCMVASRELMSMLTFDPMLGHISTFAGHPVVCAAAAAMLEYLIANNVVQEVESKGKMIEETLSSHAAVIAVRRRGLFFAIDLESPEIVQRVVESCLAKGLVTFWFLSCPSAFRIAPPLTITHDEINLACAVILEALNEYGSAR